MTDYVMSAQIEGGRGALREEMVALMADVARKAKGRSRSHVTAVAAASRVIQALDAERSPEQTLIEILGSDEAALLWMRETIPKLEARIAAKRLPEAKEDDGRSEETT